MADISYMLQNVLWQLQSMTSGISIGTDGISIQSLIICIVLLVFLFKCVQVGTGKANKHDSIGVISGLLVAFIFFYANYKGL